MKLNIEIDENGEIKGLGHKELMLMDIVLHILSGSKPEAELTITSPTFGEETQIQSRHIKSAKIELELEDDILSSSTYGQSLGRIGASGIMITPHNTSGGNTITSTSGTYTNSNTLRINSNGTWTSI